MSLLPIELQGHINFSQADSIGFEPIRAFTLDALAVHFLTVRTTILKSKALHN